MIKQIHITNFKSLRDVTVELDPVTVLIGKSGTGKTNLVEALRFLRECLKARNTNPVQSFGGWGSVLCATASKPAELSFDLTFDVPRISGDYHYRIVFQQHKRNPSQLELGEEKLTLAGKVLFHHAAGKWLHPPPIVTPPAPGPLLLGALTGIHESTIAYQALTTGVGCYSFPGDVFLHNQSPQATTVGLSDKGENYIQVLNALLSDLSVLGRWQAMLSALQRLNESIRAVDLQLPGRNAVSVGHAVGNGKTLVLTLNQESEGLRRFLAHLLALYQTPSKQTLVFEEPEKGIHPGALATLAEEFLACPRDNRGQVLLTTHSPQLLDHFSADMIRVVEMRDFQTRIGPLAPEQAEALKEQLLQPGELFTVDPARLADSLTPAG
jgi:energy-coupling factor transporter ATP-binding protein EcfA2